MVLYICFIMNGQMIDHFTYSYSWKIGGLIVHTLLFVMNTFLLDCKMCSELWCMRVACLNKLPLGVSF
jgi:hypothetical protein